MIYFKFPWAFATPLARYNKKGSQLFFGAFLGAFPQFELVKSFIYKAFKR